VIFVSEFMNSSQKASRSRGHSTRSKAAKNPQERTIPQWLHSAIFYEVYPQSFFDTNADGIGDLNGVIFKLDYIKSLGCTAVWLNPCWESPFGDAGYDVSDFRKVAPRYGTNADLKRLFKEAHRRGLKVCLDLVAGHTSTEHAWFKASASAKPNKYSNWYVWTDNVWADPGENLKAVSGYSDRDGNYVTNFFHFQPALNYGFANPDPNKPWQLPVNHPDVLEVREEMKNIIRYWLDAGADGFRVDMAASLVKNDPDFRETMAFWSEVRGMFDSEYPEAVLIAEWSDPALSIKAGFHMDFLLHYGNPAYTSLLRQEKSRDIFGLTPEGGRSFFDQNGGGDIRVFLNIYLEKYHATRDIGFISIPTGNHDISRLAIDRTPAEIEVVFAFLLTMPGIPYLYYGDEIGMAYVQGLESKEGGYGRTGSRTPMQWDSGKNAGFSRATPNKLYLPIDPDKNRPTVAAQEKDENSLLNAFRRLAQLRLDTPALQGNGDFEPVVAESESSAFVYLRKNAGSRILVAVNPSNKTCRIPLPEKIALSKAKTLHSRGAKISLPHTLTLNAASYGIFEL